MSSKNIEDITGEIVDAAVNHNPEGVVSPCPGLPERSGGYPGYIQKINTTPTGLCRNVRVAGHNPVGVDINVSFTRGSSLRSQPRAMRQNPGGVLFRMLCRSHFRSLAITNPPRLRVNQ